MSSLIKYFSKSPSTLGDDQLGGPLYEIPLPAALDDRQSYSWDQFKDKVLIITNSASKCGLTDNHYKELQELYKKYQSRGLEILAFPCDQFNNQEHSDSCQIRRKADKFSLTFPIFERVDCNGCNAHPLFQWLKVHSGEFGTAKKLQNIGWNFGKFLVSRKGKVLAYKGPMTSPLSMEKVIEDALTSAD